MGNWAKRNVGYIIKATDEELNEVINKINVLINE
jgi:hypothetical protein